MSESDIETRQLNTRISEPLARLAGLMAIPDGVSLGEFRETALRREVLARLEGAWGQKHGEHVAELSSRLRDTK